MDFTDLIATISGTATVAAISAIAVVKASPTAAAWAYGKVMGFLGRR